MAHDADGRGLFVYPSLEGQSFPGSKIGLVEDDDRSVGTADNGNIVIRIQEAQDCLPRAFVKGRVKVGLDLDLTHDLTHDLDLTPDLDPARICGFHKHIHINHVGDAGRLLGIQDYQPETISTDPFLNPTARRSRRLVWESDLDGFLNSLNGLNGFLRWRFGQGLLRPTPQHDRQRCAGGLVSCQPLCL